MRSDIIDIALYHEPENLREAMVQWRNLVDYIDEVKATVKDHQDKVKELNGFIMANHVIPDGEEKSETVSIPGVGMAYKKTTVSIRVTDWKALKAYLSRNDMEAVVRHQCNLKPSQELYELVIYGELPSPRSAEFTTFDKITLRRLG